MLPTKLLTNTATVPTRGSESAAGLDLYLDMTSQFPNNTLVWYENTALGLPVGERIVLRTGIAVAIPTGFYGQIAPRSGLAVKGGLEILAGVIDSDYRGEIMVAVLNSGQADVTFQHGDRVAQLLILPCEMSTPELFSVLPETDRGDGKFGSTGK